jgi:ribonuclease HII
MCWSPYEKKKREEIAIADSKALTPKEREGAYAWLSEHCVFGIGISAVEVVEAKGILTATNEAMLQAIAELQSKIAVTELLVDGRDHFRFPLPHRSIIRGDSLEPCIAAASIVAKVTRDRIMKEYSATFPEYGFHQHKGYGTSDHLASITKHGTCALHRKSFLRAFLENQSLPFEAIPC